MAAEIRMVAVIRARMTACMCICALMSVPLWRTLANSSDPGRGFRSDSRRP